jgi:putative peptidoglycan lipid II flippase
MNLLKSTGIIGGMTLLSRLFGFVRDVLIARVLGASAVGDAWQLAFMLPNIFRRLFAEGAFTSAFVPLFNRAMTREDDANDREKARAFSSDILSIFVPILIGFTIVLELAMPWVIWFVDDFGDGGRTNDFSIGLARVTFPYLALVSLMTLFAAILNSLSRFAAAAFAPVLLNICMIGALLIGLWLYGIDDPRRNAWLLAWGVALAGLVQLLWLVWHARRMGFTIPLRRPRVTKGVRELGVLILPALFGAGLYQISRFVDLFFLGRLEEGSFVYMAMADRLNQLPLGIIGIALGTAILPALSRFIAREDQGGAQRLQSNAVELAMLFTLPAAFALAIIAEPVVTAIYVGGNFLPADATVTANVVAALVVGLPAYVLVKVLTPGFFARKDTRTPVWTAFVALGVNIVLILLLIPDYGVTGVALAGSAGAWVNVSLLYWMLKTRGHFHVERDLGFRIGRILVSCVAMAALLWWLVPVFAGRYGGSIFEKLYSVGALVIAGGLVYLALAWLTGAIDRRKIAMLMKKQDRIAPPAEEGQ